MGRSWGLCRRSWAYFGPPWAVRGGPGPKSGPNPRGSPARKARKAEGPERSEAQLQSRRTDKVTGSGPRVPGDLRFLSFFVVFFVCSWFFVGFPWFLSPGDLSFLGF